MTDLILFNANIITLDPGFEKARSVAVRDCKIEAVAGDDALKELRQRDTQLIDCGGKTLLPGFCDTHFHLHSSAANRVTLDLSSQADLLSISDIQAKIRECSEKLAPGTWIRASGYNESSLIEGRHPTRWDLDKAAPKHPVKLAHQSRHAHVLNSLALDHVGISKYTPDPSGGLIDRSLNAGEPNGVLFEMNDFLSKRIPPLDERELNRGIMLINQELLSMGITSIHDASSHNDIKQWKALSVLKEKNKFTPRATVMLGLQGFKNLGKCDFSGPTSKDQLRLSAVKLIIDATTGQLHPSQSELNELVLDIHRAGLQVAIHAVEELAVESACSAIEYALEKLPKSDHRHRIEHCSICSLSLAKRIAALGIMVVTQPSFIYYNGDRYLKTVANHEIQNLYPSNTLLKAGVSVAGSSDSPIVPPNPLMGIYAAVSRKTKSGKTISAKERILPLIALGLYTNNAAKATFDESRKGSITPGKFADMVLLNGDPTRLPADEIKDLVVEMTFLDGKIVSIKET